MTTGAIVSLAAGLLLVLSGTLFWMAGQQARSTAISQAKLCMTDMSCEAMP